MGDEVENVSFMNSPFDRMTVAILNQEPKSVPLGNYLELRLINGLFVFVLSAPCAGHWKIPGFSSASPWHHRQDGIILERTDRYL